MQKCWVVYAKNFGVPGFTGSAVCSESEWRAMEANSPGRHTLVKSGSTSEVEAERFARQRLEAATALAPAARLLPVHRGKW